jgi:hypothetical protein
MEIEEMSLLLTLPLSPTGGEGGVRGKQGHRKKNDPVCIT